MTRRLALLHGFSGNPESWEAVRSELGPKPYVVAPILVGHGSSPHDASVQGFEGEVDRIAALLAGEGGTFHLAGYSLGGRVALGLLARHPELFMSATLIGAHPGLESEEDRADRRRADEHLCQILDRLGIDVFVAKWESIPLFASQKRLSPEVLDRQRRARTLHDPNGLARSLRLTGLGAMPSYWESLSSIRVPTILVSGSLDEKFSNIAHRMAERLPRAAVEIVPNVGHNVVLEAPSVVARILEKQLEGPS
jgi:2-succinyl-6-hydroxy-2,4-cyclohexadiene-1-carboxylate synthase